MENYIIRPKIFERYQEIAAGQSTRLGHTNAGIYPSFNLGESVGDDEEVVAANRKYFCELLGFRHEQLAKSHQVHGCEIKLVDTPGRYHGYDALISKTNGILLAVTVADCVPILLYSPKQGTIAAIHSGWKGSEANIIGKTLESMYVNFDTNPSEIMAYIGPCISQNAYEVDENVAHKFDSKYSIKGKIVGKYLLNLKEICFNQLIDCGVLGINIELSPFCTSINNDLFYSHRKENGKAGRMLAAIGMVKSNNKKQ